MCGIFGFINPTGRQVPGIRSAMMDMFIADSLRGTDGSGSFKVTKKGKVGWVKHCVPGWAFLPEKAVQEHLSNISEHLFAVGHNRAATHGKVNVANTHPFHEGNIYLVHNGTVAKTHALSEGIETESDSHMICSRIDRMGIQATIDELYGAYALVWYDQKTMTFNMLRNLDRPLNLLHLPGGVTFFASETKMAEWILHRNNLFVEETSIVPPDTLLTWKREDVVPASTPMARKYRFFPTPTATTSRMGDTTDLENRLKLRALASTYALDAEMEFTLTDFDDEVRQGNFIQVQGEAVHSASVLVKGNLCCTLEELYSNKKLLKGEIAEVRVDYKQEVVVLQLRKIAFTDTPDPYYPTAGKSLGEAKKEKDEDRKHCSDCAAAYTHKDGDVPYLVTVKGKSKMVCVSCYSDCYGPNARKKGAMH